jgi:hypothetical protein
MTQREAAKRMGVSERWVRKLLLRMKKQGDSVVVTKRRPEKTLLGTGPDRYLVWSPPGALLAHLVAPAGRTQPNQGRRCRGG